MKKLYSFIFSVAVLLAFAPGLRAQYTITDVCGNGTPLVFPNAADNPLVVKNNVGLRKDISEPVNGKYWLKLEAFATGSAVSTTTSSPSDIILILDTSSSMDQSNYTYKGTSMKRWRALRAAVLEFVQTVYDLQKQNESVDPQFKGNRIAIITYNRVATDITGGWLNVGDVVTKEGDTYSGSLIDIINTNSTAGVWANFNGNGGTDTSRPSTSGTRPDRGLRLALNELLVEGSSDATNKRADASLTVLLFTDGYPTDQQGTHLGEPDQNQNKFDLGFANNTLHYGSMMKAKGAKLYTVGLISDPSGNENWRRPNYYRVLQMMDWLSSNYPQSHWQTTPDPAVTPYNLGYDIDIVFNSSDPGDVHTANIPAPFSNAWTVNGTSVTLNNFDYGTPSQDKDSEGVLIDYSVIVDDGTDFSSFFQYVASQSGGSAATTLSENAQAVDIVSSSFVLPEGTKPSDIKVFTARCTTVVANGDAYTYSFDTEIQAPYSEAVFDDYKIVNGEKVLVQAGKQVDDAIVPSISDDGQEVSVTGFDYADNWVGPVKNTSGTIVGAQGYKVIIMIPIETNPDAVGGIDVDTNGPGSGIKDENDNLLVTFESPKLSLPVNIHINTTGLAVGESAKYTIKRKSDAMTSWEYVTTVFVTHHQGEGDDDPIVKVKGLPSGHKVNGVDHEYDYMIEQDDWGWTYTLTSVTGTGTATTENPSGTPVSFGPDDDILTSNFLVNPITFNNSKNEGIAPKVRYAESKATNVFGSGDKAGVKYDDSKKNTKEGRTIYDVTPPTGGND